MSRTEIDRRSLLGLAGLAGATAFGLTACGGDSGASSPKSPLQTPSTKPDKIIVRTWGDPWAAAVGETVAARFTDETGIKVKFDLADFGPTHVKIQQALQSGNRPPVDVVHTVGFFAEKARAQKLVRHLDPDVVTNMAELIPSAVPDSSGPAAFSEIYTYTFPMIYDSDLIDLSGGFSWSDLTSNKYPKSYFAASTFEVLTFPFAKILDLDVTHDPMDPLWDELKKVRASMSGFGQDSDFVTSLRSGQSKMGAFIAGNGVALRNENGKNIKWQVPEEGVSLTGDCVYVPQGLPAETEYWAQVFVNYWLDSEVQSAFCERMGVVPTNTNASLAEYMENDPAFPFTEEQIDKFAIPVPLEVTARNQDDWQAAYEIALQG